MQTAFTKLLSIRHPIVLAPMAGPSGGELAAAVSNAGGLGLVGGGPGNDRGQLEREIGLVTEQATRPWGIGFISWVVSADAVAWALERGPAAVMLSCGDPRPLAGLVRDAGAKLIVQVTSLDEARQALDVGADVIVAQGLEAGGHGGRRSTLPFVPSVVDLAGPVPVLAAGGIADGRGLAAALVLGAAGALVGTRFIASSEALARAAVKEALIKGHGEDTESTRVHDIATGIPWPQQYPGRAIRNAFGDRWRGREAELAADAGALRRYREAVAADDPDAVPVWAGEDIDLIHEVEHEQPGQVIGGILVTADLFGSVWRPVFLVNVPIGLAALALAPKTVPPDEQRQGARRLDQPGLAVAVPAVCLIVHLQSGLGDSALCAGLTFTPFHPADPQARGTW